MPYKVGRFFHLFYICYVWRCRWQGAWQMSTGGWRPPIDAIGHGQQLSQTTRRCRWWRVATTRRHCWQCQQCLFTGGALPLSGAARAPVCTPPPALAVRPTPDPKGPVPCCQRRNVVGHVSPVPLLPPPPCCQCVCLDSCVPPAP